MNLKITIVSFELAPMLGLAASTVRRWESLFPHRLPPFVKSGRTKVYLVETVVEWLKQKEQLQSKPLVVVAVPATHVRRRPGRPKAFGGFDRLAVTMEAVNA